MNSSQAINALAALSQKTRLEVFRLLVKAGPPGLCAGEIAVRLNARQNTMSSHLGILSQATLISRQRIGRSIRYNANYQQMRQLLLFLMQDCCQGNASICAPIENEASEAPDQLVYQKEPAAK